MDKKVTLPKLSFNVNELTKGSIFASEIKKGAKKYSVGATDYYLFVDKQGVYCIYTKETANINKNLFINIHELPCYTDNNKVEFLFILEIEGVNGFYTTRVYV